jgi:hypothetical protein
MDYVKINYNILDAYIIPIFNITSGSIISQDQDIAIAASEVWNILASEYRDRREQNA